MNNENTKYIVPTVRMTEHPEDYAFTFELPGIGKEENGASMEDFEDAIDLFKF